MNKYLPQHYIDIIDYFESIEISEEGFSLNNAEYVNNAKVFVESHIRVLKNCHETTAKSFYKRLISYKSKMLDQD